MKFDILIFFENLWIMMMKERPTKYIFKVNHVFGISNLLLTCFGAAGAPSSGSPKYPDEIVRMWITYVILTLH
jgi:hypothetical protein